jgi:exonuclease SbcC
MKFRRLEIVRLPGIDAPYSLEELGDGVHVVVGPNAIGKSSICRATRALLWSDESGRSVTVRARVDLDGASWSIQRDGAGHVWQREGVECAPPLLPARHLQDCFLLDVRDLMDAGTESGREIAEQIRLQMAGGYSLEGARSQAVERVGRGFANRECSKVDAAASAIRKAQLKQEALAEREETLNALEQKISEGETARARQAHVATALEVVGLREEQERFQAELDALPTACGKLVGRELDWLEAEERKLEEAKERVAEHEGELRDARGQIVQSRLDESLEVSELSAWRQRADSLAQLAVRREAADAVLAGEKKKLGNASRAVGGSVDAPPELTLEDHEELYRYLREATEAEQGRAALEQRLKLLSGHDFSAEQKKQQQLGERAADALRDWLRSPDTGASEVRIGGLTRGAATVVGLVVAAIGLALGIAFHPALHGITGAGLVWAVSAWLLSSSDDRADARQKAMRSFPPDVEAPASWTVASVDERLRDIDQEIAESRASEMRARDRSVEREGIASDLETAQSREQSARDRGEVLVARLCLERVPAAAELVDTARALIALREAREAVAAAEGQCGALAHEFEAKRAEIGSWLVGLGEEDPRDPEAAKARVHDVEERNRLLVDGRKDESRASEDLESARDRMRSSEEAIKKIFQDADLEYGDRAGLSQLLGTLERYKELVNEVSGLQTSIGIGERKLAEAGESALADQKQNDLERESERLAKETAAANDARTESADIAAEVRQASEAHTLEDLIASHDDALAALADKRDRGLEALAGEFLLDEVKTEHETKQLPAVLKRARDLFALFTHHEYELGIAPDVGGSFIAVSSRTGVGKQLHELSGGECAQLLLAVRIAFAEEAEGASPLPLFLDEALDQSDPARFDLIARSLGRISEQQDRQIFYLTNDDVDVDRIREALQNEGCALPKVIDLGLLRRGVASVASAEALRIAPRPNVPDPTGLSPEEYGALLAVPAFDPRTAHLGQHLLYLLWDDLQVLKRLVSSRIETVGQWMMLSRSEASLAVSLKNESEAARQLDARSRLLEVFCEAWAEGRGKPVDRTAIEESDAISERYLEGVATIATELGYDSRRLIETLEAREHPLLAGFRVKAAGKLATYLEDEGYLDPRPVLDEQDLIARALASPAARELPEEVCNDLLHRWWQLRAGKQ